MKLTLPLLIALMFNIGFTSGSAVVAQQRSKSNLTVTGKILDSLTNAPVQYATITLLQQDTAISSSYSSEQGLFSIEADKAGRYVLEISSVGFELRQMEILIAHGNAATAAGNILLTKSSKSLQEITVTGRKKIIELRPGMLVYNAEYDLSLKGGSAADVLRKAPVLNVDAQGNVSMRGSRNLKILIDGKYSGQIARNPADALNMMPANIIRSVEVITTPSAKYDAEGAAGVINIITKKGRQSVSGAIELGASNLEQVLNPRLSLNNNKWSVNFHGHLHRLRMKDAYRSERTQFDNGSPSLVLSQEMEKDNAAPHGSADIAITYTADSSAEISLGTNFWTGNWPDDYQIYTTVRLPDNVITEQYNQTTDASHRYLGADINLAYSKKFIKPGHEFILLAQAAPGKSRSPYHLLQYDIHQNKLYEELNHNNDKNREWTLQADYLHPFSDKGIFTLESGLKMIIRKATSGYNVTAANGQNELTPVDDRSDIFTYQQKVWAGYSMLKANLKKNWYTETGLRLELTSFEGDIIKAGTQFDNRFTNLIPSATVSKKVNDNQTFSLSYTQRLTRPYIWDLNPNINASDPKNITTGNPDLKPEIAHQAEFTYGFYPSSAFFLNTALFWKQTNNAIIEFTAVDNEGVATTSKQNLAANKTYGLNLSAMATLTPWWSANGNFNLEYLDFNSNALEILSKGWATHINLNSTFSLPANYSIQAFGEINTRQIKLQGFVSSRYRYSIAAKKELPAKKISLTLALTNPFSKYLSQTEVIQTPGFYYVLNNRYYNRAFKLTLNWEFGGLFKQQETKRISNDDVKGQPRG